MLTPNIDFVIAHYLIMKDKRSDFFFIQIGAFDGRSGDPIFNFVRQFEWEGILVEPQKKYFEKLKSNYVGCDRLKFLKVAISDKRKTDILYTIDESESSDLPEWAPQIASFSLDNVLKHRDAIPDIEERIREEQVECITFDDLLKEVGEKSVDLLQIDAEGYDYEIIKMIDFNKMRPSIIRFEHDHLSREDQDSVVSLLGKAGYRMFREARDTIAYRF